VFKPALVTKFALVISLILPPAQGARASTKSRDLGERLKSCAVPRVKQTNLLSFLHEESQVERGRHSGLRQNLVPGAPIADYQDQDRAARTEDDAATTQLKNEYEQALQLAARESAMIKLLALLWRAGDPGRPQNQSLLIGTVTGYVCNSGCPLEFREALRLKAKRAMESIGKLEPVGPGGIAEEIEIGIQALNEILASPHDPVDFNYYNYLSHFSYLLNTEIGPLFLMKSILNVTGLPRKEGDMNCSEKSGCAFPLHNKRVTSHNVRNALREYQQLQLYHWSSVKTPATAGARDKSIIDHYRFAPNAVLMAHAQSERFDDLLCPYMVSSEMDFGRLRANEEITAQSVAFAGRVSFWLAAGIGGFGGMFALAFFGITLPWGVAILGIATGLMTLFTIFETGHRVKLTGQKEEDARKLHQAIVSGNAASERVHMWAYMLEHIQNEKRTTGFIVGYEVLTLAASLGLAKLFVKAIPKNYTDQNQVIRLLARAHDTSFKTFVKTKYGISHPTDVLRIWPSLSTGAQSEIILKARAANFHRTFFFPTYFAKEMYDAWELYPRIIPGPGAAAISCPRQANIFRDPRCYQYCESRNNAFEVRCVDL